MVCANRSSKESIFLGISLFLNNRVLKFVEEKGSDVENAGGFFFFSLVFRLHIFIIQSNCYTFHFIVNRYSHLPYHFPQYFLYLFRCVDLFQLLIVFFPIFLLYFLCALFELIHIIVLLLLLSFKLFVSGLKMLQHFCLV